MNDKTRLGDLLVEAGILGESQLAAALAEQKRCDRPLGMTLVRMGLIEEDTLIRHLASQLRLPMARLHGKQVSEEVLDLVPLDVADKHRCFPLIVKGEGPEKLLYVAVEDPFDRELMRFLQQSTGLPIQPVLVPPSEIEEAVHRHHDLLAAAESSASPPLASLSRARPDDSGRAGLPLPDSLHGDPAPLQDDPLGRASSALPSAPPAAPEPARMGSLPVTAILRALSQLLVEKGVVTREELAERIRAVASSDEAP